MPHGIGPPGSGLSYSELIAMRQTQASERPANVRVRGLRKRIVVALGALALAVLIGIALWLGFDAAPEPTADLAAQPVALVTANRLNCRADPLPTSDVVRVAGRGERLVLHDERGPWRRVSLRGATCWVSSEYLQL